MLYFPFGGKIRKNYQIHAKNCIYFLQSIINYTKKQSNRH